MDSSTGSGPFSSFLKSASTSGLSISAGDFFMSRSLLPENATSGSGVRTGNGGGSFGSLSDKRNRNPNWTDGEIIRFLEILQEEETMKDLMAQRNKQVFCYVAQRLCSEGADKTWDQCRIKLKNLKSQYRYVKERVPEVASLDLEDDEVMKRLIVECQGKGISPSSLKHLRYLRRFLAKMGRIRSSGGGGGFADGDSPEMPGRLAHNRDDSISGTERDESVSPPATPFQAKDIKLLTNDDEANEENEPEVKRPRLDSARISSNLDDGHKFIEKFNQEMMEQFLEHQRRVQSSFQRWELDRQRQHELAMERWRSEARDHEKVMFGMFVQVMSECNSALTNMLKVKLQQQKKVTESNGYEEDD